MLYLQEGTPKRRSIGNYLGPYKNPKPIYQARMSENLHIYSGNPSAGVDQNFRGDRTCRGLDKQNRFFWGGYIIL